MPWHTNRIVLIEIGAALAAAAAARAKIAADIVLLAQTEVGEVREGSRRRLLDHAAQAQPRGLGAGARACAGRARAHCAALVAAEPHEHERAAGPWHAEWDALSEALANAGGAVAAVAEALAGLAGQHRSHAREPRPDRRADHGRAGRVCRRRERRPGARPTGWWPVAAERSEEEDGVSFRQALADIPQLGLSPEQIDARSIPPVGLEPAAALVDRVLKDEP